MKNIARLLIVTVITLSCMSASASDIEISNVVFAGSPADSTATSFVFFTITWKNSWRNKNNHDAAWVFFKLRNQNDVRSYRPCPLKITGHELILNYEKNDCVPSFYVPRHQSGVMIYPASNIRGNVSWRIKVAIDAKQINGIDFRNVIFASAYAIEMVNIPSGQFYLGDADGELQKGSSAFYDGGSKKRLLIQSERELSIGPGPGSINYDNNNVEMYRGDMKGPVPQEFPKGFDGFYVMKYELTNGQYTAFLNALSNQPSAFRSNFGSKEYASGRGAISLNNGTYICTSPERPANYISWDDGCAFADWAGLRPLTELEFEKAARGPNNTVSADFAWGTSSAAKVSRFYDKDGNLVWQPGILESDVADNRLELSGASFYWVMDLCGSLWERVVTIGTAKGRSFKGTHGDGLLDSFGNATNDDWPTEPSGGFGYRGGGTYDFGMAFGPDHAPIGSRNFGSWGDGPRSVAYGFRAALTAR